MGAKSLTSSLIRIKVEDPNLDRFAQKYCSKSVVYSWGEKQRRINTGKRSYAKRHTKEKISKFSYEFIEEIRILRHLKMKKSNNNIFYAVFKFMMIVKMI